MSKDKEKVKENLETKYLSELLLYLKKINKLDEFINDGEDNKVVRQILLGFTTQSLLFPSLLQQEQLNKIKLSIKEKVGK